MDVYSPPGTLAGRIEQEWSICEPKFTVKNASGDVVLRIEGPFCTYGICGDVEFQVSFQFQLENSIFAKKNPFMTFLLLDSVQGWISKCWKDFQEMGKHKQDLKNYLCSLIKTF